VTSTFKPPPSYSKKKQQSLLEGKFHTVKPDSSNILKAVEDALNNIAYKDDSQICDSRSIKRYGLKDNVTIEIEILRRKV
jgi:Holliday junction resolvase RusA-like endonuclease